MGKKRESKKQIIFNLIGVFLILSMSIMISAEQFGYNNPSLPQLLEELFGGQPSSFYMPNNKSVFGNFSFNRGWELGGLSIIDGDIYAQTGYFLNITSLNVTKQNLTINDNLYVMQSLENLFLYLLVQKNLFLPFHPDFQFQKTSLPEFVR